MVDTNWYMEKTEAMAVKTKRKAELYLFIFWITLVFAAGVADDEDKTSIKHQPSETEQGQVHVPVQDGSSSEYDMQKRSDENIASQSKDDTNPVHSEERQNSHDSSPEDQAKVDTDSMNTQTVSDGREKDSNTEKETSSSESIEESTVHSISDSENQHSDHRDNSYNTDVSNQSFLSFGSILKNLVDPVFEDLKEMPSDSDSRIEETSDTSFSNKDSLNNLTDNNDNITNTVDKSVDNEDELSNKTDKKVRFQCSGKNLTDGNMTSEPVVKIVNNTGLLNLLNFDKNESVSDCVLVLFFAPWCPFCAKMAPNYNALARAFPQLEILAVDAAQFSNLNARFGTVLVPNILLFHQSRAVVRFNQTNKSFENLASFVKNVTGLEPNSSVNVTAEDFDGPLSSIPTEDPDYLLWVAWLFVLVFTSIVFIQSTYGQQCITKVRILWQEHQHIE